MLTPFAYTEIAKWLSILALGAVAVVVTILVYECDDHSSVVQLIGHPLVLHRDTATTTRRGRTYTLVSFSDDNVDLV